MRAKRKIFSRKTFFNLTIFTFLIMAIFFILDIKTIDSIAFASNKEREIILEIDGKEVEFQDNAPYIDENNRILIPLRFFVEKLDAFVNWEEDEKKIEVITEDENRHIKLWVGEEKYKINGEENLMDTTPKIKEEVGRTFVPLRFISEAMGKDVKWEDDKSLISIKALSDMEKELAFKNISINTKKATVLEKLGEPERKKESKYGFTWYIYNEDYENYVQLGIKNDEVQGIFSNSDNWSLPGDLTMDVNRKEIKNNFGEPLDEIIRGNYIMSLNTPGKDVYLLDGQYIFFFFDKYNEESLDGILTIKKEIEGKKTNFYSNLTPALIDSFEIQLFELTNVLRVKNNLEPFDWSEEAGEAAREHSESMAENEFFSHLNLDGKTPFDRLEAKGIDFASAAENINMGQSNAIISYYYWLNSKDHRSNLLNNFSYIGIGVACENNRPYYTQKFYAK